MDDFYNTRIVYDPSDAWEITLRPSGVIPVETSHRTSQANAKLSLAFQARSISVNCYFSPTGSNFTATLDGTLIGTYSTYSAEIDKQSKLISLKDNLDTIPHEIVLEKVPTDPEWVSSLGPGDHPSYLQIDSIILGTAAGLPSSLTSLSPSLSSTTSNFQSQIPLSTTSTTSTPQSQSSPPFTVLGTGAIAGIVIPIFSAIVFIVVLIWYRRRLIRAAHPSTSPFIEAGIHPDDKKPEQVTELTDPPTMIPLSSGPVSKQAAALVPMDSSLKQGAAVAAAATTTSENPQLSGGNIGDAGPSLNPTASSIPPPSGPLPSSIALSRVNVSLTLQEYSMLRDRVPHIAALQRTGGLSVLNEDGRHSDYHEPPPEYVERGSDEEDRP